MGELVEQQVKNENKKIAHLKHQGSGIYLTLILHRHSTIVLYFVFQRKIAHTLFKFFLMCDVWLNHKILYWKYK